MLQVGGALDVFVDVPDERGVVVSVAMISSMVSSCWAEVGVDIAVRARQSVACVFSGPSIQRKSYGVAA